MRRSRKLAALAVILVPLFAGGFLLQARGGVREGAVLLEQVLSLVSERFVDTLPEGTVYEKAARGLVRELNDPYTELLSPKELKQFTTRTGGRYGGLGMQIEPRDGQIVVSTVFPNTPAERNGVRDGDRIIRVDTTSTKGWSTQQTSEVLLGTPGTKVRVGFSRPGVAQPIDVEFTRAIITVPAVPFGIMFGQVGYVKTLTFSENATDQLEETLERLVAQGAKGVIIDFRNNPGGILEQSLSISNLFLPQGAEIASVRSRSGVTQSYVAREKPELPNLPLIILTDEGSASASEIVAGALQDHDRAVIVGQTSFGKGLVQSVYNLDGGYALKLTTAKWYTPSGRSIQRERRFVDGRFVEDSARDSLETETSKRSRPAYRSDGGRIVYGGGGIAPDVLVGDDTLTAGEQQLVNTLAPKAQDFRSVMLDYTLELSKQTPLVTTAQQSWRDELWRRIQARDIEVTRQEWNGGSRWIDQQLEHQVVRYAAGDSAAARHDLKFDPQLRRAIDLMTRGQTQKDLFTLAQASARTASGAPDSPSPGNRNATSRPPQ